MSGVLSLAVAAAIALAMPAGAGAVVGGRVATPTDNPSMVGLSTRGQRADADLFCGGALIAPTVVVTAMHCLDKGAKAGDFDVVGGALSRQDPALQRAPVAQLVRHPVWTTAARSTTCSSSSSPRR